MADTNILALTEGTNPVGSILYIVDSGSLDKKITFENFIKPITDLINTRSKETGKATSYTKSFPANSKLESVDIKKTAGTPTVTIGTTLGGDEIMPATAISNVTLSPIIYYFSALTTVYITISGGTVSLNWNYYENYF